MIIVELVAIAIIAALAICIGVTTLRKRKHLPPSRLRIGPYENRPFPPYGDLYTYEEFLNCLKRWHMTDGTSHWASAEGEWFDTISNDYVRANVYEIRNGKPPPQDFFTHIMYFGK